MHACRSRGSTGRSRDRPEGDYEKYKSVHQANIFVERLVHVLLVAYSLGVFWAIEQPASSDSSMHYFNYSRAPITHVSDLWLSQVLWRLPAMRKLLRYTKAKRISFAMCTYGAPTLKPTVFLVSIR